MKRPQTLVELVLIHMAEAELAGDLILDTAMACMWNDIDTGRDLGEIQAFVDRVCFDEPAGRKIQ